MSKKFSYEEKVEAVRQYMEEGKSLLQITKEYGTCPSVIDRWIRVFKMHGNAGLKIKPQYVIYSEEFKNLVVDDVINNNLSKTFAAAKYNISHCVISKWCVEYLRGYKVKKTKRIISREEAERIRAKYKDIADPKVREILERNEYLEMENEALKKLRALTEQEK